MSTATLAPAPLADRESPTLGPHRGRARAPRRRSDRTEPFHARHPAQTCGVPDRKNLRCVGGIPFHPARGDDIVPTDPGMGAAAGEPDRVRALRHGQDPAAGIDIGLLPVSGDAAEGFYRVVEASYEKRSLAISSNIHPSGFDELMPKTIATATVDRLMHHAHLCQTSGESVRLMQAQSGKGTHPMN